MQIRKNPEKIKNIFLLKEESPQEIMYLLKFVITITVLF